MPWNKPPNNTANATDSQTSTAQPEPKKDIFSGDVKFITAVVFGFVIILVLVWVLPRVGHLFMMM